MGMKAKVVADPRREAEFDRAFELLQQLVDLSEADRRQPLRENAVYPPVLCCGCWCVSG